MNDTYTFQDKENKFEFTVRTRFLENCADPQNYNIHDLLTKFKLNQYFHNLEGPALIRFRDSVKEYWIDGIRVFDSREQTEQKLDYYKKLSETYNNKKEEINETI